MDCLTRIYIFLSGTRIWLDVHKHAEIISEFVYYGLTTLCLRQTLGEEYTGILQVDSSRRKLPNRLVSTSSFFPRMYKQCSNILPLYTCQR